MARREISSNHQEEIEYRLLQILRQTKAFGPTEIKARYAAIVGLASLWNIDLDKQKILYNLGFRDKKANAATAPPDTTPGGSETTAEKPLIDAPLGGDIFGELEGDPDEQA